ncbi:hypothetical protein OJAV_G00122980 [Oryzias javanicus]|uniref:C2H2-type domain-containing protein n=1 Tax=Oryzias javanicus TaxID=123683 RepID=A0A437CVE1_ORYJA|nr:hypothetical protein OJAV_G00122980 [Oryzias javanicus]
MKYLPPGSDRVSPRIQLSQDSERRRPGPAGSPLTPSDPLRQAKRLPIRLIKMLTAHSGHLLHPEYLQPLTSAPVSIELDAKKSPLALLAQTCSQIGKPDPPCSKLSSSCSQGDKESASRSSASGLKLGEHRPSLDDKSSFKPYSKGGGGECRSGSEKVGFRVTGSNNATTNGGSGQPPCPPHAASPSCRGGSSPPGQQLHKQTHSPAGVAGSQGGDAPREQSSPSSRPRPRQHQLQHRSSDGGSNPDKPEPCLGAGHVTPISPFKSSQPLYPLPPSSMGYQGAVMGGSSPLTGASPPSFMQGLCRDPYCLSYPSMPHLGGSSCNSCLHDPSSTLKSSFPMVYPSHPLHSLHQGSLSSSVSSSLSHPLYSYGFMLPNDPLPHACNWVSAGGPCDKRFATSDELLAHLRTHTALTMDSKLLAVSSSGPASCHLHLPHQSSSGSMPSSLSLRGPPSLGLARYHPYSKVHLPSGPSPISLPGPYYPHTPSTARDSGPPRLWDTSETPRSEERLHRLGFKPGCFPAEVVGG